MANKYCVIGTYFGKFPENFPIWLKSCESNKEVDFKIFADCSYENLPENVEIIKISLAEMKKKVSEVLGFEVCLKSPYKCCDYKAIYGLIFKDYSVGYDYVGHCDFDMVFGDLAYFFKKYEIEKYDRFLPLGHLSLYKNEKRVFDYCNLDGGRYTISDVAKTDKICCFDEIYGLIPIYEKHKLPVFKKVIFADIAPRFKRMRMSDLVSFETPPKNYKNQIFYYENGKTFRAYLKNGRVNTEEYIYVHFQKRKCLNFDFDVEKTDAFYITNKGFVPKSGEVTQKDIKKYNPYVFSEDFIDDKKWRISNFNKKLKYKMKKLFK